MKKFRKLLQKNFYKNGCNYEGSLPYQRFLLEFLLITQYFFLNYSKHKKFINIFQNAIEKIWNYSKKITGDNHKFKQFGDLDFGQVIKLNVNNYYNLNELKPLYNYTKHRNLSDISLFNLYNKKFSKLVLNVDKKFISMPGYSRIKIR